MVASQDERRLPQVFVSRPAALTGPQRDLERAWLAGLGELGFAPIVLGRNDYGPDPWSALRGAVASAHGALILGFRQIRVDAGQWRPGTAEARDCNGWSATPWNQLEAGFAIMANLPVLLVPEREIADGVFAGDVRTSEVQTAPIDVWASQEPTADPAIQTWSLAVAGTAARRQIARIEFEPDGAPRTRT